MVPPSPGAEAATVGGGSYSVADAFSLYRMLAAEDENPADSSDSEGEGSGPSKPVVPIHLIQPGRALTFPSNAQDCPNRAVSPVLWQKQCLPNPRAQSLGFLSQLGSLCIEAGLRDCQNEGCRGLKARMEKYAPACNWEPFRQWVLTALACQVAMSKEREASLAHTRLSCVASSCCLLLKRCLRRRQGGNYFMRSVAGSGVLIGLSVDLASVADLVYWAAVVQSETGIGLPNIGRWDRKLLPVHVGIPPIELAMARVGEIGLCKNRVWSLAGASNRKEADLPDIIRAIEIAKGSAISAFHQHGHGDCLPSKCQFSQIDSGQVKQMCKCGDAGPCKVMNFNLGLLAEPLEHGESMAWSCAGGAIGGPSDKYMAISHVWSDGTGVGLRQPGRVNKCLFEYFADIAKTLGCTALWWDAISLPMDPDKRSRAIANMHTHYAKASCTILHDRFLADFPWDNDGGPCLALVLSSWFTRGWTALELLKSRQVKVLFKDPESGEPLIKDLNEDVLAKSPATSSRGHWLATLAVQRLRERGTTIREVGDLMAVLHGRSTSWARDRTIIPALLAEVPDFVPKASESEITRRILSHLGSLPTTALLHGNPTMLDAGAFSWCPATLDELPVDVSADMAGGEKAKVAAKVAINGGGGVEGCWWARPLRRGEVARGRVQPMRDEGAAGVKITAAMRRWRGCVLLRDAKDRNVDDPVLLVMVLGARGDGTLQCRYAGAVVVSRLDENENLADKWQQVWAEIGGEGDVAVRRPIHARRALHIRAKFEGAAGGSRAEAVFQADMKELADFCPTLSDDERLDPMPDPRPDPELDESQMQYRREDSSEGQQVDHAGWDETRQDPRQAEPRHLLAAVLNQNSEAIRYLTEFGIELADGMNIDPDGDASAEAACMGVHMLGDALMGVGKLQKAIAMYQLAADGLGRTSAVGHYTIFKAKHALGNAYVKTGEEGRKEDAKRLFSEVLTSCKPENVRPLIKAETSSAASSTAPKTPGRKRGGGKSYRAPSAILEEWKTLEFDAFGNLVLLLADRGDVKAAAQVYRQALGKDGEELQVPIPFAENWLVGAVAQLSGNQAQQHEHAVVLYHRMVKRLQRVLGERADGHPLALITLLNLGISQIVLRNFHARDTEDFLGRSYSGCRDLLSSNHKITQTAAYYYEDLLPQLRLLEHPQRAGLGDRPPGHGDEVQEEMDRLRWEKRLLELECGSLKQANKELRAGACVIL